MDPSNPAARAPDTNEPVPLAHRAAAHRAPSHLMEYVETRPLADVENNGKDDPDIGAFVTALLRAKWVVVGVTVLVSAAAIPWIWLVIAPSYKAAALIQVKPVIGRVVFDLEDNVGQYRAFLNTQVSIIRSGKVLQRVLENEDVRKTEWFSGGESALPGEVTSPSLEAFATNLFVAPIPNTELIEVAMNTRNPEDAKLIVDTVVDEFKEFSDENNERYGTELWETLSNERMSLQNGIRGLQETSHNLTRNLGTDNPEDLRSQLTAQLSVLEGQSASLQRELDLTEWDLGKLVADIDAERQGEAGEGQKNRSTDRYATDPEWYALHKDLQNREHELVLALQQFGDGHPLIRQLETAVEHANDLLDVRETQLEDQIRAAPRLSGYDAGGAITMVDQSTLQRLSERQKEELQLRWHELEQLRGRIAELGSVAKRISGYDDEIKQKSELYEQVRKRLTELEMEGKAPARIVVASYALKPTGPDTDRRKKLTVVAAGGAFMMGLGVAFLLVRLDSRIHQIGDVRGPMRIPFLGQLPTCPSKTDLMGECPPLLTESIRMFRTALLERLTSTDKRIVLITSSSPVSGKTSVSILLAKSLAALGKKVLLVEADLRRPSVAAKLHQPMNSGLASTLVGSATDEEAIVSSGMPGFDVIMAGHRPKDFNPELLANGIFSACLTRWKKKYDYVLLDSPPVLPVADAQILAGQADGVVMVLRASHSRRAEVIQAYADLSAAGGTLLGTVLVDVNAKAKIGYYGDYQADEGANRALTART